MEKQNIYLCDIDGTLAEFRHHRGPFDEHLVKNDSPLPTIQVIRALEANGAKIIFFSGRTDKCYTDTREWLQTHLIESNPELYMRKQGDFRGDDLIKKEMYDAHIKDKYNVIAVFDDRLRVCKMWYELGLFVLNCNQGLKEF